jgi:hypothetical protein
MEHFDSEWQRMPVVVMNPDESGELNNLHLLLFHREAGFGQLKQSWWGHEIATHLSGARNDEKRVGTSPGQTGG